MGKSASGEVVMREEGGSGLSTSSASSSSSLLAITSSSSASACPHDGVDGMSQLERRRSGDDNNNKETTRLPAIFPVNVITTQLLELLQQTTEQRRQVARLIRSIDLSIPIEGWYQHDDHEFHQYHPDDHDYRRYDHHHKEEEEKEEEEEEEASKCWRSTASSDDDGSSQYSNNDALIFLRHKVSQLRRQVALLTHDLLAAKARNRLLRDQLQYNFLGISSSITDSQRQPPQLPAEHERHTPSVVEESRECSEEDGEEKNCYNDD